ncbi:MAG: Leucine-responsive regulatory protein [Alphaproteobacteria bacterium MarineAlpha2_Bin1]|nr:MAG: Leucine-responsive regulatory protein [Alphaproteobacteria bacterium MarineAlpha2_Bin1]|tara:strand:- start:96 stop:545 length:450 start_codon:yes stop_codon:yes gene_type:complete
MDDLDLKILRILQSDSRMTVAEIGKQVGLSSSPCWKRINKLTKDKIIIKHTAILNQKKLGYNLIAFVSIKTANHSEGWLKNFSKKISLMQEVIEFYRMAGDVDYMLKVIVRDIEQYDSFYKKIIEIEGLKEVSSRFSMEMIKNDISVPI